MMHLKLSCGYLRSDLNIGCFGIVPKWTCAGRVRLFVFGSGCLPVAASLANAGHVGPTMFAMWTPQLLPENCPQFLDCQVVGVACFEHPLIVDCAGDDAAIL